MNDTVLSSVRRKVCTITLNRPERLNALNSKLLLALGSALDAANSNDDVGAILLRGSGRAFCSGDDLKDFEAQSKTKEESQVFIESIQDITRQIVLGKKIVVGSIHGWAVGGGLEWAINCDLAVFADNTQCFFPELKWGMFPTGGVTSLLPRIVGLVKAKELMLLGEVFDASEAKEMGLAWKVVPKSEVYDVAHRTAEYIAGLPEHSVQTLKCVLNATHQLDLEQTMKLETDATVESFLNPETLKRVKTFDS